MCKVLDIGINETGPGSLTARQALDISNTCKVFAESEVVSHLSEGCEIPAVLSGVQMAAGLWNSRRLGSNWEPLPILQQLCEQGVEIGRSQLTSPSLPCKAFRPSAWHPYDRFYRLELQGPVR